LKTWTGIFINTFKYVLYKNIADIYITILCRVYFNTGPSLKEFGRFYFRVFLSTANIICIRSQKVYLLTYLLVQDIWKA